MSFSDTYTLRALWQALPAGEPAADAPRLVLHGNRVLATHELPGLTVEASEHGESVEVRVVLRRHTRLERPVHLYYAVLPERGRQSIRLYLEVETAASLSVLAFGVFPNPVEIAHTVDAEVIVGDDAELIYVERQVHGREGGLLVNPRTRLTVGRQATVRTDLEITRGRIGSLALDFEARVQARGRLEVGTRLAGQGTDFARIDARALLIEESAQAVLRSRTSLRDRARLEVVGGIVAAAPHTSGHVDSRTLIGDDAAARAYPTAEIRHPLARATQEVAVGAVDPAQLDTLMAHGLTEDEAVAMLARGLVSDLAI